MNWGLRNRLDRVLPGLPNETGSVMFAIDHGYFMGPTSGLEDPRKTIVPLLPHADGLMLSRYFAKQHTQADKYSHCFAGVQRK